MKIKITDIMKTPGKPFEFDFEYLLDGVCVNGEFINLEDGVKVSATCVYTGESYNLTGSIKCAYATVCDRCAIDVGGKIDISFSEEYATRADLSHPDRYLFDGHEIDLDKMVEDNIVLVMPMKHLCKSDCKGLCPVCGCDFNEGSCECGEHQVYEDIETVTPFAGLKKLMEDNKEV